VHTPHYPFLSIALKLLVRKTISASIRKINMQMAFLASVDATFFLTHNELPLILPQQEKQGLIRKIKSDAAG